MKFESEATSLQNCLVFIHKGSGLQLALKVCFNSAVQLRCSAPAADHIHLN